MDNFKNNPHIKGKTADLYDRVKDESSTQDHDSNEQESSLIDQVKETAGDIYEHSKDKLSNVETCIEDYTRDFVQKIKEKPLSALLIAGGIGFIISHFLKK